MQMCSGGGTAGVAAAAAVVESYICLQMLGFSAAWNEAIAVLVAAGRGCAYVQPNCVHRK